MNIKNILTKIIFSDLHLYFFYGFILSIPFQIRKRFLTEHSYFAGGFSEYATFFVYLSDVLLILAVFFWVIKIIIRRDSDLSHLFHRYRLSRLFHIGHAINRVSIIFKSISKIFPLRKKSPLYKRSYPISDMGELDRFPRKIWFFVVQNEPLVLLSLFCLWLVVDLLLISGNYFSISAYQTLKFLELAALFIYIYFNLTSFKRILTTVSLLALSGLIQSLLAISQYFLQHSVFGSKWIGEIVLSPELPGVAKIVVDGDKIMRAYGTFPHPNILAGFLLITVFLSWYLLTNYPQFINKSVKNRGFSLLNILRKIKSLILDNKLSNLSSSKNRIKTHFYKNYHINNVSRETLLSICFTFLIFIQILALILTFSRSGWLGSFFILLILAIFYFFKIRPNVSRETLSGYFKILYSNKNILNIMFLAILIIFSIIFLWPEISSRNLSKESLVWTNLKSISTIGNITNYKKELRDYPDNVSRETLSDLENKENQNRDLAITDRLFYNKVALNSISKYPFTGTGLGTFVFQIDNYMKSRAVIARKFAIDDYGNPKVIVHNSMIYNAGLPRSVPSRLLSRFHSVRNGGEVLSSVTQNVSRETLLENGREVLEEKNNVSRETLSNNEGEKQKFLFYQGKSGKFLEFWRYQPAHNIYLLIASEIGIMGFLIFALFVTQVIKGSNKQIFPSRKGLAVGYFTNSTHPQPPPERGFQDNVSRETFNILQAQKSLQYFLIAIFIGFLAIGMFDHYFWTLRQGRLEFWLILALIAANERNFRNLNYLAPNNRQRC